MKGQNYFADFVKAPQIIQGTPNYNVEVGEGNNPPGDFYPAPYLKVAVSENIIGGTNFVLMPGKVIAFDSAKRLIGAGLAADFKAFKTAYEGNGGDAAAKLAAGRAAATIKYDAADVQAGIRNAQGNFAVADALVVESMYFAGLNVTDPIGIMRYTARQASGSDPYDPSSFYKHNYDTGPARAFTRWGYIQIPVVEVNERAMAIGLNASDVRLDLYMEVGEVPSFYKGGVEQTLTLKTNPTLFSAAATAGVPTEYAMVGRTIFINEPVGTSDWEVRYTPKVDLPFSCLKYSYGSGKIVGSTDVTDGVAQVTIGDFIGKVVGFDTDSNYQISGTAGCSTEKIGRILDVKLGSSKDLALVRTYMRDFGLWQEAPGSATDGRNAILSIANAPKYIVRIAINFNLFY